MPLICSLSDVPKKMRKVKNEGNKTLDRTVAVRIIISVSKEQHIITKEMERINHEHRTQYETF